MSERRVGPFIIDENEYSIFQGLNKLDIDDPNASQPSTSLTSSSHERRNEFSVWNNDQPELFHHPHLGYQSNPQNNAFFGTSKSLSGGMFNTGLQTPNVNANSNINGAIGSQLNMAPQPPTSFPIFTPRQHISPSYNNLQQHHQHQQQQQHIHAPVSLSSMTSATEAKPSATLPKTMTAAEFHLTRFGSFRLSVSPPDSLMVNEEEDEDEEKVSSSPKK
uniref:Uncharacterized protein n=1 Tax=Panagrolaimus sp. ES5 TaxID=591445 RepID=A0AC34GQ19_9BILA